MHPRAFSFVVSRASLRRMTFWKKISFPELRPNINKFIMKMKICKAFASGLLLNRKSPKESAHTGQSYGAFGGPKSRMYRVLVEGPGIVCRYVLRYATTQLTPET
jgi:hypothetical protein